MYSIVLLVHVSVGVLALLSYWTAGLARKGSRMHRTAGRVFMLTMLLILASALVFVNRMVGREAWSNAAFFSYLTVISATALATGWLSLRWKQQPQRYHGRWYRWLAVFNMACGGGVLLLGVGNGDPILIGFSAVGVLRGRNMWRFARHAPRPRWWLHEHLGSMIGNGVAVHVAFLLVGLQRLLPASWAAGVQWFGWLLPLGVAAAALSIFRRHYRAPVASAPTVAA